MGAGGGVPGLVGVAVGLVVEVPVGTCTGVVRYQLARGSPKHSPTVTANTKNVSMLDPKCDGINRRLEIITGYKYTFQASPFHLVQELLDQEINSSLMYVMSQRNATTCV